MASGARRALASAMPVPSRGQTGRSSSASNPNPRTTDSRSAPSAPSKPTPPVRTPVYRARRSTPAPPRPSWNSSIDGSWTMTVRYGPAFTGIGEAVFSGSTGQPIEGLIDGRPLRPIDGETDLSSVSFANDEPTPEMDVEPGLAEALGRLFARANEQASTCLPPELEATPGAASGVLLRKQSAH